MRKVIILLFIILILFLVITGYNKKVYKIDNHNEDKFGITTLTVEKINLKERVYEDTIKSKSIKGIVLFKEFGRPNIENSNTIIGAHSGNGKYSLFKDLDKLEINDTVYLLYKNIKYEYKAIDVSLVYKVNTDVLRNIKERTTLTLFTCNEKDDNYRLVILLELIDFIQY